MQTTHDDCVYPQETLCLRCSGVCTKRRVGTPCKKPLSTERIQDMAHRMAWRYKMSADPHHSDTYTFNLLTLIDFARAIEAEHGVTGEIK